MRGSLWLKLMGAFIAIILLGSVIDTFLVTRSTQAQFSRYITANGQNWAQRLAPSLAAYYTQNGSWNGVESLLQNPWQPIANGGMMGDWGMEMEHDGMGGMSNDDSMQMSDSWGMMGFRLLLADPNGNVFADTLGRLTGSRLANSDLAAGTPILAGNARVGTLLAVSTELNAASPASDFVSQVNHSTWLAGLIAVLAALVLGSILFRQIVSPVQRLTSAAQKVAAGDLGPRIEVKSQDEIGQLSAAFNQMADALARDRDLRRNLIADVTHELRTPLSILQGNLEAMLDGVLPANPEEIASLRDETALLARLVSDLSMLSLAEAGQLKLERAPTDLGALIARSIEPLRLQAESQDIHLSAEISPGLPPINVDSDRIEQVIRNLVGNALRYTPGGGMITIRANPGASGFIQIQVQDTGTGIAKDDLPYVFDRFYRAEKSRNRSSGGSGIGLAIVKQLVKAHGGEVWVESQPGHGATFSFNLPVSPQPNFL